MDKAIELECCACGRVVGFFDWERLPRALRATLRALVDTFAGGAERDDGKAPFPILCHVCKESGK